MSTARIDIKQVGLALEAIRCGQSDKLMRLVDQERGLLDPSRAGENLLIKASRKRANTICKWLIDNGMDVNWGDSGTSALDAAAMNGHVDTAQLLLDHGAWVDESDVAIGTPLMAAAGRGYLEVVELLLDAGAEINREHLREPMTATAWAEFYRVTNTGQAEVAAFLRERGGINPFNEGTHDWKGVVGSPYMDLIEGHIGAVHPWPFQQDVRPGQKITIRRSRFAPKAPKRFYFHLLFTVDLGPRVGVELAVCLPREWPLHDRARQKAQFRWPLDLLSQLGAALLAGRRLAHGDLVTRDDPALAGLAIEERLDQWLCVQHRSIEDQRWREPEAAPVLLLVPNIAKTRIKPGKDALAKADAKAQLPWNVSAAKEGRNSLVVPLCYDAPWLHSPLRWS